VKKYYWSLANTDPAVYHDKDRCLVGRRIKMKDKAWGDYPPGGCHRCEECRKISA